MHLLAYNLIRTVMVESAHQHDMHLQPVISADRRNIGNRPTPTRGPTSTPFPTERCC